MKLLNVYLYFASHTHVVVFIKEYCVQEVFVRRSNNEVPNTFVIVIKSVNFDIVNVDTCISNTGCYNLTPIFLKMNLKSTIKKLKFQNCFVSK